LKVEHLREEDMEEVSTMECGAVVCRLGAFGEVVHVYSLFRGVSCFYKGADGTIELDTLAVVTSRPDHTDNSLVAVLDFDPSCPGLLWVSPLPASDVAVTLATITSSGHVFTRVLKHSVQYQLHSQNYLQFLGKIFKVFVYFEPPEKALEVELSVSTLLKSLSDEMKFDPLMHTKEQVLKVLGVLWKQPDNQTRASDAMDVDSIAPQTDNDTKGADSENEEQPSISFEYSSPLKGPTVSPPRSPPKPQDLKRSPQMSHSRQVSARSSQQASQAIAAVAPPTPDSQRSLASSKGIAHDAETPPMSPKQSKVSSPAVSLGKSASFEEEDPDQSMASTRRPSPQSESKASKFVSHDAETPPLSPAASNVVESGSPVSIDLMDDQAEEIAKSKQHAEMVDEELKANNTSPSMSGSRTQSFGERDVNASNFDNASVEVADSVVGIDEGELVPAARSSSTPRAAIQPQASPKGEAPPPGPVASRSPSPPPRAAIEPQRQPSPKRQAPAVPVASRSPSPPPRAVAQPQPPSPKREVPKVSSVLPEGMDTLLAAIDSVETPTKSIVDVESPVVEDSVDPSMDMSSFPIDNSQSQTQDTVVSAKGTKKRKRGSADSVTEEKETSKTTKKAKTTKKQSATTASSSSSSGPCILFTKLDDNSLKRDVTKLGAKIVTETKDCTHLIVDKFRRNFKFFGALMEGKWILHPKWIKDSAAAGKFLPEEDYAMKDDDAEGKYGFSLEGTLKQIKESGTGQIFEGMTLYCTSHCEPSKDVLKEFIVAAGGKMVAKLPKKVPDGLIAITGAEEAVASTLTKKGIKVYTAECVFAAILRQSLENLNDFKVQLD
jgi:hypothetical protein